MANTTANTNVSYPDRSLGLAKQIGLVIGASAIIAVCARLVLPLPFTPVPLTLANFGVLLVGLALGSKRGFAAAALYLGWGAMGLPVFSPAGPGGFAQLLGPTAGYLWAYPVVAFVAGWIAERGKPQTSCAICCRGGSRVGSLRQRAFVAGDYDAQLAACRLLRALSLPVR